MKSDPALLYDKHTHRIEKYLARILPLFCSKSPTLQEAIEYSVLNGGKRLRPHLVYTTATCFNIPLEQVDAAAGAIELLHCYSLVHDDLPAMDDDDLRRGRATCHKAFNEATAILVGDGLQSLSFELLSSPTLNPLPDAAKLLMIQTLAKNSGIQGMVAGQMCDLQAENKSLQVKELTELYNLKTGCLLLTCIQFGIIASNCTDNKIIDNLNSFALDLGLAFQIQDDILEATSTTTVLGKSVNSDEAKNKATFPKILGLEHSTMYLHNLYQKIFDQLTALGPQMLPLQECAEMMMHRNY